MKLAVDVLRAIQWARDYTGEGHNQVNTIASNCTSLKLTPQERLSSQRLVVLCHEIYIQGVSDSQDFWKEVVDATS